MNKSIKPGLLWYVNGRPLQKEIQMAKDCAQVKHPGSKIGRVFGQMEEEGVLYDRGVPVGHLWVEIIQ